MATLSVIRRWALRGQLSIREIARRTGLSRNTIRKYLRDETQEPAYAKRESRSRLDLFAEKLAQWLKTEAGKNRKQRRTLKQMHAELMELGFDGSYSHYLFEAEFCNPASGWEKGQIEKNVRDARHRLWQPVPAFPSLDALYAWLEERCKALWADISHGQQPGTVFDAWQQEKPLLMRLPRPFDGFVEHTKRVSPTCLITFERTRYSVPASYANRPVSLRVYADRLVVAAEGNLICEHKGVIDRRHDTGMGQAIYDWRHYLAVLQRKPGALRNGAPFTELPVAFKRLQAELLKKQGGDRGMVDVLALVLHHEEQSVLAAVELALEVGVPTKMYVLNVLHRLLDGKADPPPVDAPHALRLATEPQANVTRYVELREERKVRHA